MFYVFPEIIFVFGLVLRARTRFSRLLFSSYVLILFKFVVISQNGSEIALAVECVAAYEVQCSAARFARDHSGCWPLQIYVRLYKNFIYVFGPLVVEINLRQTRTRRVVSILVQHEGCMYARTDRQGHDAVL